MNNWGEEIVLHSHRIPWLIWIQLLVLFLLILLLSYLGLFSVDFAAAAVSSSPSKISSAEVGQEVGGGSRETQAESARSGRENDDTETDESAGKKDLRHLLHPCYYLDLAKKAFLQCLGLGNGPSNPRERAHEE